MNPDEQDPGYPLQAVRTTQGISATPGVFDPFAPLAPEAERPLDLRRFLAVLVHRKWLLVFAVILALIIGLIVTLRTTPIYRATAVVEAQPPMTTLYGYQDFASGGVNSANFAGDQIQVLKSAALAQRVARDVKLSVGDRTVDSPSYKKGFFAELRAQFDAWIATIEGREPTTAGHSETSTEDQQTIDQLRIEQEIHDRLKVDPIPSTNMLKLSIDGADPRRATDLINAVAKTYVASNMESRFQDSTKTQRFYDTQVSKTRAELEDMERRLIAYARGKDLVSLENLLEYNEKEFGELKTQLFAAEQRLFQSESKYSAMREAGGLSGEDFLNNKVVQELKTRRAQLADEYQLKLEVFLPDYPKMVQLRSQIDAIDRQLKDEMQAIAKGIEVVYQAAKREKELLAQRVEKGREDLLRIRDQTADYQALKREHMALQAVYDGLMGRLKESGIVADVGINNLAILDLAKVPTRPYKPNLQLNMIVALVAGLAIGVGLIVLIEKLDDTVKSAEEVERLINAPILGNIPYIGTRAARGGGDSLRQSMLDPKAPTGEAGRSLRTTLMFATAGGAPKVLHFTSAAPGEGKTTTSFCTALAFAQSGATVLCIDADLRNPSLHRLFDVPNDLGLSNYLVSDIQPAEIAQETAIDGMFVVTSGPLPPNPVELLASSKMVDLLQLAALRFDYVFVDGPPVLGLADAPVLATLAGATLFVVEPGQSRKAAVLDSIRRLRASRARVIGAVLQKVGRRGNSYGYGYGYKYDYHYMYGYGRKSKDLEPV